MSDYLELTFEIASEPQPQKAKVRPILTVEQLIENITVEFEAGDSSEFELFRKGSSSPLSRYEPLAIQGIQSGDTLVFTRPVLLHRRPIKSKKKASLKIEGINKNFYIQWQPAVIGRPDANPVHSGLLAVNLIRHRNSRRVSRQHAQITEDDGTFFLESLTLNNPTYLNNEILVPGELYPLKNGDSILLSNSKIRMKFFLK